MLLDGRSIPDGTVVDTDVAIIGAGAAGITLARELAGTNLKVALIESGGLELEDATQALYEGESGGVDYPLTGSRLRYFGGTTNHWGGWCRPLMPIDFEGRPKLGIPAWPIQRDALEPYYRRARALCQIGDGAFDDPNYWDEQATWQPIALPGEDIVTRFFLFSPPTRFGTAYRDDIARAGNVTTYLHSNVTEIVPSAEASRVERLQLAALGGGRFEIRPKACVLATGGIENARLLLASNSVQPAGLGNGHDLVGRYFMEHVTVPGDVAVLALTDRSLVPAYYIHSPDIGDASMRAVFMASDETLRRESRLGISLSIYESHPPGQGSGTDREGELGMIEALKALHPGAGEAMVYGVACALEPLPVRDNRVTLTAVRDALGLQKLRLDWRPTGQEHLDLARNLDAFARAFGRWGGGAKLLVAEQPQWPDAEIGWGNHHMGTTRMADDPSQGVVDANCQVHGLANLYVAGSSVFPSASPINPTLTIVALALRLADRIKMRPLG